MIPVFRPAYDDREVEAVAAVLRSGWIGLGPKVAEFEERFAHYVGARHAVALNSCTSALHLALHQLGIGPGDEVLVPTMTFVSTASVVRQLGATPVFCDVDPQTLLINWDDARRRLTPHTKAALPVLYAGQPLEVPADFGLPAVYDCAHAVGANWSAAGRTCCWSLHAVKNLATGDGGMLTTDDAGFAARARRLRWLGIDKSTWDRTELDRRYWWEYRIEETGFKYHMNDIAAALGLVQLEKLPQLQARRRELVACYRRGLPDWIEPLSCNEDSAWHLFVVRCDGRDDLAAHLAEAGISSSVHYKPLHLYPCFGSRHRLPVAETVWPRILTLPLFPDLTGDEVEAICRAIHGFRPAECRSGSDLILRPLTADDLDFARTLRNRHREWFFDQREITAEEQQAWFRGVAERDEVEFFLLWEGGRRVGTVSLNHGEEGTEIGNVALVDEAQRRGLMRRACRQLLNPGGCYRARVRPENVRSRRLFEQLGFTVVAKADDEILVVLNAIREEPATGRPVSTSSSPA